MLRSKLSTKDKKLVTFFYIQPKNEYSKQNNIKNNSWEYKLGFQQKEKIEMSKKEQNNDYNYKKDKPSHSFGDT